MSDIVSLTQGAAPGFRLCLSASGSIGKKMTATRWKSCQYWRPYARPGGGKTAAQEEVRGMFAKGITAWSRDFRAKKIREDWNRLASYGEEPMSGYNAFCAAAFHASMNDPESVFIKAYMIADKHLVFDGATISGHPMPTTSQEIDLWIGYNPWQQNYWTTRRFYSGLMWSPDFPGPGTYYIRMTSQGVPVSGLIRVIYKGL